MTNSYVGTPYVDGGRDSNGCDCYGLVRLVFFENTGIELPSYGLVSASDTLRVMRCIGRERALNTWGQVTKPEPFDVVLMAHCRHPDMIVHIGIMMASDTMLHTEEAADAHLVSIHNPLVKTRICGFFRHHRLIESGKVRHAA